MNISNKELLKRLQNMDEYEFEYLIAELWEKFLWNTTVTSGSNDRGVDIVAKRDYPVSEKHLIQAKRYSSGNKIGSQDVQLYNSLKQQRDAVDCVVIVTTGEFTTPAKETASSLNVKTVDNDKLIHMMTAPALEFENNLDKYLNIKQNKKTEQSSSTLSNVHTKQSNSDNNEKDNQFSSPKNKNSSSPKNKNSKQNYPEFLRKRLKKLIQKSKRRNGNFQATVYLDHEQSGYAFIPQYGDNVNIHAFYQKTNKIRHFHAENWEKITHIARNHGLSIITKNMEGVPRMFVGEEKNVIHLSKIDRVMNIMDDFLTGLYPYSIQDVTIEIDRF